MTKKDLIRATAKAAHVTQETADKVLTEALEAAFAIVASGETLKLQGYGTFHKTTGRQGTSSNLPNVTGIAQPPRDTIKFTVSPVLRERLTAGGTGNV